MYEKSLLVKCDDIRDGDQCKQSLFHAALTGFSSRDETRYSLKILAVCNPLYFNHVKQAG